MRASASAALILALSALGAPAARAQVQLGDEAGTTAGTRLREAWTKARQSYPDAVLTEISGHTDASGRVLCSSDEPFQEGWRYTFYTPKDQNYVMMGECRGRLAGPLTQMMAVDEAQVSAIAIKGRFPDSDEAIRALERGGIPLDPDAHKGGGKRPFSLTLKRLANSRFPDNPVVWRVTVGKDNYLVDGAKASLLGTPEAASPSPGSSAAAPVADSTAMIKRAVKPKEKIYSVKKDLDRVEAFVSRKYPGARLMGIEGFVDAWGGAPCVGRGDGWAYYYYHPKSKGYKTVYSCNGALSVGGSLHNIPLDMSMHQPISGVFVDSTQLLDAALVQRPRLMDETLGKKLSRTGELLLVNFRASPFSAAGMWKTTLVWRLRIGTTIFRLDAADGKVVDIQE